MARDFNMNEVNGIKKKTLRNKVVFWLLAVSILAPLSFVLFCQLTGSKIFNKDSVIKNVQVFQSEGAVVGKPIKWTAVVNVKDINSGSHLIEIPKSALNVKVRRVSAKEAEELMVLKNARLTTEERKYLVMGKDSYLENIPVATNNKKFSLNTFLAEAESVVQSVVDSISAPISEPSVQAVDVSPAIEQPVEEPVQEEVVPPEDEPVETSVEESAETETQTLTPSPIVSPEPTVEANEIQESEEDNDEYIVVEYTTEEVEILEKKTKTGKMITVYVPDEIEVIEEPSLSVEESPIATPEPSVEVSPSVEPSAEPSIEPSPEETPVPEVLPQETAPAVIPETIAPPASESLLTIIEDSDTPSVEETPAIIEESPSPSPTPVLDETPKGSVKNVLAYTTLPEIFKVGKEKNIKVIWRNNNNKEVEFKTDDLDNNGFIDYIEWNIPHLSKQTFEIIFISEAFRLDSDRNIIEDVYEKVKEQDGNYALFESGQYLRATFETKLDNTKDITIYAKSSQGGMIEVYEGDGDQLIASFENISEEKQYKVFLTNLQTPTDTFDLKIIGNIEFDYIVDPAVTYYWVGAAGASINVATNWSTIVGACGIVGDGAVPGASDTAVFDSTCTNSAAMDTTWSITALDMQSGYMGTVTQTANLSISGNLTVSAGTLAVGTYDLSITGSSTATGGTVTIGISAATGWTTVGMTIGTGGVVTCAGASKISVSGDWTKTGTFTYDTSTVTFNGTAQTIQSATTFYHLVVLSSTQLDIASVTVNAYDLTVGSSTNMNAALRLNHASDAVTLTITGYNYGTITQSAGTMTANAAVDTIRFTNYYTDASHYGTYNISGGTLTITNGFDNRSAFNISGASTIVNIGYYFINQSPAAVSISDGTINVRLVYLYGGTVTQSGGTFTAGWSDTYGRFGDNGAGTGVWHGDGGLIKFATGGATGIYLRASGTYFYNVEIYRNSSINASTTQTLVINGNLTIDSGKTFTTNDKAISVKGNWTNSGGTFAAGAGTVTFDGSAADTTQSVTPGGSAFNAIVSANTGSGTAKVQLAGALTCASLSVTNGAFDMNNQSFNFSASAAAIVANGAKIQLHGSETWGGNVTNLDVDTGTVEYIGNNVATTLTIKNFGSPSYFNLTINDTNTNKATYQLGTALAIAGALSVTSGTLDITTYDLAVTGTSDVTGGTATIGISAANGWSTTNMTIGAAGTVTCTGTSKITVSGNWLQSAGTFTKGTSTVDLTGTGNLAATSQFYILKVAASGYTTTLTGNIGASVTTASVTGLTFGGGALNFNGYELGVDNRANGYGLDGNGTTFSGTGTLKFMGYSGGTHILNNLVLGTNVALRLDLAGSNSSTTYSLTGTTTCGALTVRGGDATAGHGSILKTGSGLSLTATSIAIGSGTEYGGFDGALGGTVNVNGAVTITHLMTGSTLGTSTWNVTGNWANNDTVNALPASTSQINFTATSPNTQTLNAGIVSSTVNSFYNLTHSGAGTLQLLTNNLTLLDGGTLTNSAGTFDTETNSLAVTVGTTGTTSALVFSGGTWEGDGGTAANQNIVVWGNATFSSGTFKKSSNTLAVKGAFANSGTAFTEGTGTITVNGNMTFSGTGTFTKNASGLIVFASGTANQQLTSNSLDIGNIQVSANTTATTLTLQDALNADNITIDASQTFSNGGATLSITCGGNWANSGAFTSGTGTVTFDGSTASTYQTLNAGSSSFYNLTINNTGTGTSGVQLLTNNLTATGAFTNTSGIFDTDTNDKTVTVTGLASINGGTYAASSSVTQTFNGGLTIAGGTLTGSSGAVDVNGTLTLSSGTLTAPSGAFTVSGNWIRTLGTFTQGTNTVTFDGTSQTISGATTFYNLTAITPDQVIIFPQASTTTVSGTLKLEGTSGHNILLKTDEAGVDGAKAHRARVDITAVLDNHSNAYFQYVTPYDNNASNGAAQPIQQQNCTDGGNNSGWAFDLTPPVLATGVNPTTLSYDNAPLTVDIADVGTCTDATSGMHATQPYQVSYSDAGTSPDANCSDNVYTITTAWGTLHSASFTGTDGHYYCIKLECKDAASTPNTSAFYSDNNILYDITPPTTTDDYGAKHNVWQTSVQTITLTPADAASGVASTSYCVDLLDVCNPALGAPYTVPVPMNTEGTRFFRYASVDKAGNTQTTVSKTVKIDTVAPSVDAGADQAKNAQFDQDATAFDATSGIASYLWSMTSGPGIITFGSVASEDTSISADTDGTYVIRLTVTDVATNPNFDEFTLTWDTTAPVLSNGSPSGSFVWQTTSATMSLITDENATCRYSSSAGTAYDLMIQTFTTTGTTSHSVSLTGLSAGMAYTYYVRCVDATLNKDITDYAISFSVDSYPPKGGPSGGGGGAVASPSPTPSPSSTPESEKGVIEKIGEILGPAPLPKKEISFPPINISEKAPLSMSGIYLIPEKELSAFVFAPLPNSLLGLNDKLPKFNTMLNKLGVNTMSDVVNLKNYSIAVPSLSDSIGLSKNSYLSVNSLSKEQKDKIPTGLVFARLGKANIDAPAQLSISNLGVVDQKINVTASKKIKLVIKPESKAKSVKGYLVFKSKEEINLNENKNFFASAISALASTINSIPPFASEDKPEIEEKLVVLEFEYTDPDNDGIYTAEIDAPVVEGNYDVMTVIEYVDEDLNTKVMHLLTVVDPEGYIYTKVGNGEMRISNANVSLYYLNSGNYELWNAKDYGQENPQMTNNTGKYSFLVPEGDYYIKVEAPNYSVYQSENFNVKEGEGIHRNIELKFSNWTALLFDWKTLTILSLVAAIIFLLFFNKKKNNINLKINK